MFLQGQFYLFTGGGVCRPLTFALVKNKKYDHEKTVLQYLIDTTRKHTHTHVRNETASTKKKREIRETHRRPRVFDAPSAEEGHAFGSPQNSSFPTLVLNVFCFYFVSSPKYAAAVLPGSRCGRSSRSTPAHLAAQTDRQHQEVLS